MSSSNKISTAEKAILESIKLYLGNTIDTWAKKFVGKDINRVALDLLHYAIKKEAWEYLMPMSLPNNKSSEQKPNHRKKECKLGERCFAYELYRQWANLLELYNFANNLIKPECKYYINGEIPKAIHYTDKTNQKSKYPDLVFHKGQWESNPEDQVLICEIKRYNSEREPKDSDILKDLKKLKIALTNLKDNKGKQVPYKRACFIFANADKTIMIKRIKASLELDQSNTQWDEVRERILCIAVKVKKGRTVRKTISLSRILLETNNSNS